MSRLVFTSFSFDTFCEACKGSVGFLKGTSLTSRALADSQGHHATHLPRLRSNFSSRFRGPLTLEVSVNMDTNVVHPFLDTCVGPLPLRPRYHNNIPSGCRLECQSPCLVELKYLSGIRGWTVAVLLGEYLVVGKPSQMSFI